MPYRRCASAHSKPAILRPRRSKTVQNQDSAIEIAPADPDVVYVPAYDPWLAYGYPLDAWPGWYPYPGSGLAARIYRSEQALESASTAASGGAGIIGDSTGMADTQCNNRNRYYSRSNTFYNRSSFLSRSRCAWWILAAPELVPAPNAGNRSSNAIVGGRAAVSSRPATSARAFNGKHPSGKRVR